MGSRNWTREPYLDTPPLNATGRVKLSTNVEKTTRQRFHAAAQAMGVSLAYLFEQLGERIQIDEATGTVTVDGTPITNPRRAQETLVMSA